MRIITNRATFKKKFIRALRKFLRENFFDIYNKLEIVFVSDSTMRKYNRRFSGKNKSTDVLSFDIDKTYVIIVSVDTARKNAILYGEKFEDEVLRYVVHGILHLLGFDHKVEAFKEKMRNKEEEMMEKWKVYYYY